MKEAKDIPDETKVTEEKLVKTVPQPKRTWTAYQKPVLITLAIVVAIAVSFAAGMQAEKHHNHGRFANGHGFMQGAPHRARTAPVNTVTAVSSTSITVENQRTGASKTYTIDDNTKITKDGATIAVTDIKVGDSVLLRTGSATSTTATSTTATTIEVNPRFMSPQTDSVDSPDDAGTQPAIVN